MAKKAPSKHSRAARRATSPGIDVDKSLKNAKPPPESLNHRPSILGLHQSAGVHKKGRKAVLSSKARRRRDKALERGEAVAERTTTKIQKSKRSSTKIQSRSKAWDEINKVAEEGKERKKGEKVDPEQAAVDEFYATTDEEMSDAEGVDGVAEKETRIEVQPAAVPLSAPVEDEDEIL